MIAPTKSKNETKIPIAPTKKPRPTPKIYKTGKPRAPPAMRTILKFSAQMMV